ncbi:Hsp70 family protein [Dactylosporangium sp. CS-047395]|uniref:Hsp70 family protein n=1 Tax=Dactylosporangium sp. CS-047395 TaxID=3239936 RepID=UPI003D8DF0FF
MQTARLGIDFGTSHTVAVLARDGGRADALLFEASPLLPSAVYLGADGLLVGRDAERSARIEPSAYEPHPKRRIDDGSVLLNGHDVPVPRLVEAILRRVAEEATRTLGGPPGATVLTHPAGWGATRRTLLTDAATAAGLPAPALVAEPVAAAMYFTGVLGHRVPDGHAVVVYDFGGGTFDISVVRRTGDGWHVAAANGLDDVGGIDLDAAIIDRIRAGIATGNPEVWQRLEQPATVADRRHRRALWEDARSTKELLSRSTTAAMAIPLLDVDLYLTRPEFEALARPWLDRTIALTTATLFASDVTAGRLAGVFLVGGGSRVPLVATLLHQALGIAPVILEQPELVVAHGSLLAEAPATAAFAVAAAPVSAAPVSAAPGGGFDAGFETTPAAGLVSVSGNGSASRTAVAVAAPVSPPPAAPTSPPPSSSSSSPDAEAAVPEAAVPRRLPGLWAVIAFAVVAGLGALSLLLRETYDQVSPPFVSGLLTPLQPASVLVLLAMMTAVVVGGRPGDPGGPAYRALGPAVVAAAGGVLGLLVLALTHEPDDALSIDGNGNSGGDHEYAGAGPWILTVAGVLALLAVLYRIARPHTADPLTPSRPGRARWFATWAAAGAVLVIASNSPVRLPYAALDGDGMEDMQPLGGLLGSGGELAWWGGFLFGLTLMLTAGLALAALLRPAVVRDPAVHTAASRVGFTLIAGLTVLLLVQAAWEQSEDRIAPMVQSWYWYTFIGLEPNSNGHPWFWLVLAIGASAGVVVPSLVRNARRKGTGQP